MRRLTVAVLLAQMALSSPSLADTLVADASPALGASARAGEPAPTYAVQTGAVLQLSVRLEAEDGTSTDVTSSPETQFLAYRPAHVSVSSSGLVTVHAATSAGPPPAVAVLRGDQLATIVFQVAE